MSSFCPRVLANVEESIIETQYKSNHSNVYLKPVDMYVPISLLQSNGPLGIIHPPLYSPWLHVHAHGKLNSSQWGSNESWLWRHETELNNQLFLRVSIYTGNREVPLYTYNMYILLFHWLCNTFLTYELGISLTWAASYLLFYSINWLLWQKS